MTPSDDDLTQLLFVEDEPAPAELALVFGSADPKECDQRTARTTELFHAGLAPRLLLTGSGTPEAARMADCARALGVPAKALLIEDQARTTYENATLSLLLLQNAGLLDGLRTALLVSAGWHLGRALLLTRRVFPAGIRWKCCPTNRGLTKENWRADAEGRRVVLQEWSLLRRLLP